jgi:hypothetical protein
VDLATGTIRRIAESDSELGLAKREEDEEGALGRMAMKRKLKGVAFQLKAALFWWFREETLKEDGDWNTIFHTL